jgi:hypothetical protein
MLINQGVSLAIAMQESFIANGKKVKMETLGETTPIKWHVIIPKLSSNGELCWEI